MKRFLFMALLLGLASCSAFAQSVTFKFSDGIYDERLKSTVEQNISSLLTNINKASSQRAATVNLSGLKITPQALKAFNDLWTFMSFTCDDHTNVASCVQTVTGYQVRGIPVTINDAASTDGSPERELTIGFNSSGEITGVFFSLEQHMVNNIIRSGMEVKDMRQREEIAFYVDRYRSYYDEKDLKSIEDVFSDDAIIITGREVMRRTADGVMVTVTQYKEQDKKQYIDELRNIFRKKSFVKVVFKGVEVMRHPTRKDVYMVRLHQNWRTPGYEDNGYVVLLWQFPENGGDPRILVRTWQSDRIVKSSDDMFNITDFEIY